MEVIDAILQTIFWLSVVLVFYCYVGYPWLLKTAVKDADREDSPPEPGVRCARLSVLFAAYNEERVLREKLKSIVESDFPMDRLEVLIGDDGSSDLTAAIASDYARRFPFIRLVRFGGRNGKPTIINSLAERAVGDVLLFTDANIIFARDAFRKTVSYFNRPDVGLVGGNILSRRVSADGGISLQEDAYVRREIRIKRRQSIMSGVFMAPFGACYAIRRSDFRPVPVGHCVDDFYISMQPLIRGRIGIQALDVICHEDVSQAVPEEFRRKVRMSRGNFQNLMVFRQQALRPWTAVGFHFVSHKVLRWLCPGLLVAAFCSSGLLALSHPLYLVIFCGMAIAFASPLLDAPFRRKGIQIRPIRFASYFVSMNVALAIGFLQWTRGRTGGVWEPTRRA